MASFTEIANKILTKILTGGRRTSAENTRDVLDTMNGSYQNKEEKDQNSGYLGIDENGRVNATKINSDTPNGSFLDDSGNWTKQALNPLFNSIDDVGNVGTGETDLVSDIIVEDTLSNDGDRLECEYSGTIVAHATATRTFKYYFDGNVVFSSGALTFTSGTDWVIKTTLIRDSISSVRCSVVLYVTRTTGQQVYLAVVKIGTLDFTAPNILLLTGQAGAAGAATDDIVKLFSKIDYIKTI